MAKAKYGSKQKYHYFYKTTNLLSGRYYYGIHSTSKLEDGYLGSGTLLKRAINKYGRDNFKIEILEFFNSREELEKKEKEVVNLDEIRKAECMNLKVGGLGGFPPSAKQRYRELLKDSKYKEKLAPKFAARGRQLHRWCIENGIKPPDWTGRKHRPDTIGKMKEVKKQWGVGDKNSQFGTMWITSGKDKKKIKIGEEIPEGWYSRKLLPPPPTMWITDGINSTIIKSTEEIPEGWNKGRTFKKKG